MRTPRRDQLNNNRRQFRENRFQRNNRPSNRNGNRNRFRNANGHFGHNSFHRSGFSSRVYKGKRFSHGLHHSHGGHGYFCLDHSVFHYFLGFDPFGYSRIGFYGRSNFRYPDACFPVEKLGFHKGRKAIFHSILCYDEFDYPYLLQDSTFVYEYY